MRALKSMMILNNKRNTMYLIEKNLYNHFVPLKMSKKKGSNNNAKGKV
jgi:hypothetical protein